MQKNGLQENIKKIKMKSVIKKAAKYESKKSLDGPMKFLKGNVAKPTKSAMPKKKK
jgi:UDP-glucose 4-epimerase